MNDDTPEPPNTVRRRTGLPPFPQAATEATHTSSWHEDRSETCTAMFSLSDILRSGPEYRCGQPAGHYDETREANREERDPGGWHCSIGSGYAGHWLVWKDGGPNSTPHEPRCPGCGHTDGEGCGCPQPAFTTLEVREDETPAVLRELTVAVRELVAVLREDLDGRTEDAEVTDFEPTTPATTCSAQHRSYDDGRQCIRAAHHHGDHIDERGFHWSDTVAMYPVVKMISHDGPVYAQPFEQRLPDWLAAGTRDLSIPEQRPTLRERHRTAWEALTPAEKDARIAALDDVGSDEERQAPAEAPDSTSPLSGIETRVPCPYCPPPAMIASTLITDHIARLHHPGLAYPPQLDTSDDVQCVAHRRDALAKLLDRLDLGEDLTGKGHELLRQHVQAEESERDHLSNSFRTLTGYLQQVGAQKDAWKAKAEDIEQRAEQLQELLQVANETANRSEAERGRIRQEHENLLTRWRTAQITVDRVRQLRDRWILMTLEPGQVRRLLDEVTHALDNTTPPQEADQIRAYIDTALREGYWAQVDLHTHRLLQDLADWTPVGVLGSIEGLDDSEEDPPAPAFVWPHLHGKTALTARLETSFTYTRGGPFDEALNALDAIYRERLDRRLARLAGHLGQWEVIVRRDFHAVQRVLEDAGVLDGYGRLAIPQPVRLPVIWEDR